MENKVTAPFTDEQVAALNKWQKLGHVHPFTCCNHDGCNRAEYDGGVLIPSRLGWTCPCGKYKQYWAHVFMADELLHPDDPFGDWREKI